MSDHRSPSGRYIDWLAVIATATAARGRWVTGFRNAPVSIVRDIRERRREILRRSDSHRLEAQARNVYPHPDFGTEYADIYVRWVPITPKEKPMAKDRHDLKVTDITVARLDALATMAGMGRGARSQLADDILREYGEGAARLTEAEPYRPVALPIYTSPGVWEAAVKRAELEGVSVTFALTEFTKRRLEREQQIRSEGASLE